MLGLALVNECIRQGIKVIAVIRENSAKQVLLPVSDILTVVECDLEKISKIEMSCRPDVFYHFAWECTDNKNRNCVDAHYRNVGYTLDAVKLAHQLGCRKFIGAGSQAEYGRVSGIVSPDMRVAPDSAYGISKYSAGRMAAILCEQLGLEFVWTRIFSTYGINDMPSTMIMYCINSLLKSEKPALTKCEQIWDYLNCEDAAKAFYMIGEKGKNQALYNIGSGNPRSLLEYVTALRDAVNPDLALGIGEKEYSEMQVMNLCPDISNLQNDTGFKPVIPFEEGIVETIAWYKRKMM